MRTAALALVLLLVAVAGCDDSVCDGPVCAHFELCPPGADRRLGLEYRWSIATDETANPESVNFVPDEPGRALVTSALANRLSEVFYDGDQLVFGDTAPIDVGNSTSALTSVVVGPGGGYAVVTVADFGARTCGGDGDCPGGRCVEGGCACYPGAIPGCSCGFLLFLDIRGGDRFGRELGRIGVGYAPDSAAFAPDGSWLVSADEDDAEELACKPGSRYGGSVSVIRVGNIDPAACETPPVELPDGRACRVRQIPVNHARGAEPEQAAVTSQGDMIIAIQETDQLAFATPTGDLEVVELQAGAQPDGLAVSRDGTLAAVAYEAADSLVIVDVASRTVVDQRAIDRDVPADYNRDLSSSSRVHEPEQVVWLESQGIEFVAVTLQESHALAAYRFDRASRELTFDSIAPVGIGYAGELGGTMSSGIGPEGLAAVGGEDGRTLFLTANEREGSVTLVRSSCP